MSLPDFACARAPHTNAAKPRWLNLWPPPDDDKPNFCHDEVEVSDLDPRVVVGNIVLILTILAGLLVVHIVIVSAVEAFWLTKVSGMCCPVTCMRVTHQRCLGDTMTHAVASSFLSWVCQRPTELFSFKRPNGLHDD